MSKARTLADIVAAGSPLVDGTIETTDITNVTASATELNYVDGVTSNVQTQMDTKAPTASPTFTGTAVIPTASVTTLNLGGTAITATATELNYVDGVTSAIQTQLDTKAPTANPTFTTGITSPQVDITSQGDLRLQDSSGGQYVALQAPATISSNYTLTMPAADGSADQVLKTNGSGTLSFGDAGGGDFVLLSSGSLTGTTNLDLTTSTTYKNYKLLIEAVCDTSGNRRPELYGTYDGSTYSSNNFAWAYVGTAGGSVFGQAEQGFGYVNLLGGSDIFAKQFWGLYADIDIFTGRVSSTEDVYPAINWTASASTSSLDSSSRFIRGLARDRDASTYLRGIRFRIEGVQMDSGYYAFYGLSA